MAIGEALAIASVASKLLGGLFGNSAAKRARKVTAREQAYQDQLQNKGFAERLAAQQLGDARQLAVEHEAVGAQDVTQRAGSAALRDVSASTFDEGQGIGRRLLGEELGLRSGLTGQEIALETRLGREAGEQRLGFADESIGIADRLLDKRTAEETRLLNTLRDVRTGNIALTAEELAKQRVFQSQADELARQFIEASGAGAFTADQVKSLSRRLMTLDAVTANSPAVPPTTPSADPYISRRYAEEVAAGRNTAKSEAALGARLNTYTDALTEQDRRAISLGEKVSLLDDRAGRSASTLIPKLNVNRIVRDNAGEAADANISIAARLADAQRSAVAEEAQARASALSGFGAGSRSNLATYGQQVGGNLDALRQAQQRSLSAFAEGLSSAFSGFYENQDRSEQAKYERQGGVEFDYTGGVLDASRGLETGLTALSNRRIASAGGNAPSALSSIGDALAGLSRIRFGRSS